MKEKNRIVDLNEEKIHELLGKISELRSEIGKKIIGQEQVIEEVIIAFLAGGHCLLEGVPGLAKTMLVRTISEALQLSFKRIQFTPDLMPADVLGTEILEEDITTGKHYFKFNEGPVFANLVLADEINRTPPKTQAALLEAMQEHEVTYGGKTYKLPEPFFLLATQNPIEQAGTYSLPEAQLDRFLLYIKIGYPSEQEELRILSETTGRNQTDIKAVLNDQEISLLRKLVKEIHISDSLISYVANLVRETRPEISKFDFIRDYVDWGAGPRAGQAMILASKARAILNGRFAVTKEDILVLAYPVLRHRIMLNFSADSKQMTTDQIIGKLLQSVKFPENAIR